MDLSGSAHGVGFRSGVEESTVQCNRGEVRLDLME